MVAYIILIITIGFAFCTGYISRGLDDEEYRRKQKEQQRRKEIDERRKNEEFKEYLRQPPVYVNSKYKSIDEIPKPTFLREVSDDKKIN